MNPTRVHLTAMTDPVHPRAGGNETLSQPPHLNPGRNLNGQPARATATRPKGNQRPTIHRPNLKRLVGGVHSHMPEIVPQALRHQRPYGQNLSQQHAVVDPRRIVVGDHHSKHITSSAWRIR